MSRPNVEQTAEPGEGRLPTIQLVGGLSPLRYGQAIFNDAYRIDPELADQIRTTPADPFYEDECVPAFLRALVAAAEERGAAKERERIAAAIEMWRDEQAAALSSPDVQMDYEGREAVEVEVETLARALEFLRASFVGEAQGVAATWRTGRKVGRTIYQQVGETPSDDDRLIGVMDTPELAALAVQAVNLGRAERAQCAAELMEAVSHGTLSVQMAKLIAARWAGVPVAKLGEKS